MSNQKKIKGGYYLKARQIDDSAIAHAAPHVREAWDWLIKYAQHTPYKTAGKIIERGQVLTNYDEIAEDLHWMVGFVKHRYKKHHIDYAMRWLRDEKMITTQKTTRGLVVTICNYAVYQDPKSYENANDYDTEKSKSNGGEMVSGMVRGNASDMDYDTATSITNSLSPESKDASDTDYDTAKPTITTPLRQATDTINKNVKNNKEEIKENIRGEGDLQPLHATPAGFQYLPDGRSYIEPTVFFTKANFNGLPKDKNDDARRLLWDLKGIKIEEEKAASMWETFKGLELTFQKPYRNEDDVYRHFANWFKKQPFAKPRVASLPKPKSTTAKNVKITGVEWINNFTQCRMSDGSIQDLDTNQQDSAQYDHISPSAIVKR